MSADWNITQGDNSFMAGAMPAAVSDFAAAGGAATGAGLTAEQHEGQSRRQHESDDRKCDDDVALHRTFSLTR
jgi:hypothetical protein